MKIEVINAKNVSSSLFSATFDEFGGNIGRAENNVLILPDPEKHISRLHASIAYRNGQYYICNHGSVTPTFLNGSTLAKEQSEIVHIGDEIRIGTYTLKVIAEDDCSEKPPVNIASDQLNANPFEKSAEDPFNMSREEVPEEAKPAPYVGASRESGSSMQHNEHILSELIPEDFDPFSDLPVSDGVSVDKPFGSEKNQLTDNDISLGNGQGIDVFIESPNPVDELSMQSEKNAIDPILVLDGAAAKNEQPELPAQRDDVPEICSAFVPPKPQNTVAANSSKPLATLTSVQNLSSEEHDLLRAFLTGTGIQDKDLSIELTPEFMHLVGTILRSLTQGTLDLLSARSMTKQEMHANMTLIAPKENNPLKFSPDVEAALTFLLKSQNRGFMTSEQAVNDAYEDLKLHQFGFMSGMRAALTGLLEKFRPQRIELSCSKKSIVDKLIPGSHKSKLWDSYTEHYDEISREAEEDFHTILGKEFLRTYESQIAKFKNSDQ